MMGAAMLWHFEAEPAVRRRYAPLERERNAALWVGICRWAAGGKASATSRAYSIFVFLGWPRRHGGRELVMCADCETSPMDLVRGWRPRGSKLHEWIKSFLLDAKKRPRWVCCGGAAQRCGPPCAPAPCFGDVTSFRARVRPQRCFKCIANILTSRSEQ